MAAREKTVAGIAAVVLVAGGGGAIAIAALGGSSPGTSTVAAQASFGGGTTGQQGFGGGPGPSFRSFGDGDGGPGRFGVFTAAAGYLGVSTSTLMSDLATGKTLATVATAQGKTVAGLIDAIVAAQKQQLDAAVSAGRLSKAQEQSALSGLTGQVTALVNGSRPGGFGRPGFGDGGRGRGLGDGGPPDGGLGGGGTQGGGSGSFGSTS